MAAQVPTQSVPAAPAGVASLCDYCLQKPKFGTHDYCSKTCANQAAALCKYCHKKPKFQGFDYCGKTCSSAANAGKQGQAARNPTSNASNAPQSQAQGSTTQAHAATGAQSKGNARGNNPNRSQSTTNATSGINAAQIAQIVAQQLPQLVAAANATSASQAATGPSTAQGTNSTMAQTSNASNGTSNNPFLNMLGQSVQAGLGATTAQPLAGQQNSLVAVANGTPVVPSQSQTAAQSTNDDTSSPAAAPSAPGTTGTGASAQPSAGDTKCLIPGCNQPVYVDATGVKVSNYCSKRHREEAVTSGLVVPCIMCLASPQGSNDYFCSRACREDANHKSPSQSTAQPVKST